MPRNTFNRTTMELKLVETKAMPHQDMAFNRTTMELKRHRAVLLGQTR